MTCVTSEQTIKSVDGTELYLQRWAPPDGTPIKAELLIAHGFLEHGSRYAEFAQALAQETIAVNALDCRGHGNSSGLRGFIDDFQRYHEDMDAALDALPSDGPPRFILGHSHGGLICFDYFRDGGDRGIAGLILTNPWVAPAEAVSYIKIQISKFLGKVFPKLAMDANLKSEDLTHDSAKIEEHKSDTMVLQKFTLGWAVQAMVAQARVKREVKDLPLPVLFVYSDEDKIADSSVNKQLAEQIVQEDKTVVLRKGEYHEVLNEVGRKELYGTLQKWVLERV